MKKMSKFSLLGIAAGLIFAIGSFIRYYILYQDLSEVVVGVSIGLLISGLSWLYNVVRELKFEQDRLEDYLADKGVLK